jgi:hypothetical protein
LYLTFCFFSLSPLPSSIVYLYSSLTFIPAIGIRGECFAVGVHDEWTMLDEETKQRRATRTTL